MSIADSPVAHRALQAWRAARAIAGARAAPVIGGIREHAPIVGDAAVRRRSRIVLQPYKRTHSLKGSILRILGAPALALLCLVYGFFFALTAPTFIVAFVVPLVVLTALIIWALPHQRTAPTLPIEFLFPSFFVALILWPNYLAVSLPGLPWITLLRIIGLPMAGLLLISLSVSPPFRKRVAESVSAVKLLWIFMCGFMLVQIVTTVISTAPAASAQLVFNHSIYWIAVFVIACVLFRDTRYVERYWGLLCLLAVPIAALVAIETRGQHIPWAAHIPAFLRIPDPSVQLTLAPSFRPGINLYRAKGTFSTPLGLAEYLSLLTPFFLHFGFWSKNKAVKIAAFAMIPILFLTIRMTDARLGLVGMLVSLLGYGLLWSIVRWRSHPRDIFAAATVYAYPAVFVAGVGLVFASHRINLMVFGDGAQASSTEARKTQLGMAISQLVRAPWGHGTGQCGPAMGYSEGSFITIDNYFITVALDYGILGLIFWYGIFIIAMVEAARYSISSKYAGRLEARLLAPLAVTLAAFLVIKWVHGQDDNHSMLFMMVGMVSALIYKLRNGTPEMETASSAERRPLQTHAMRLAPVSRSPSYGLDPRQMAD
jgi:hypothetical protein